jgi:hypothetical protein
MTAKPKTKTAGPLGAALGDGEMRALAQAQAESLLRAETRMLQNLEDMARGWLDRRRQASEATLDAVTRMCACKEPSEIGAIYNDWLTKSFDRWAADSRALGEYSMHAVQDMIAAFAAGAERAAPATKAAPAPREARRVERPPLAEAEAEPTPLKRAAS